ncbi:MAG: sigma-70 family RNA polymerase sigma factor [Burkholderiaceae bacterium]|nr:sigma-70 family RNA polymerase sigma factor [Burkholderiaceae bacterium]
MSERLTELLARVAGGDRAARDAAFAAAYRELQRLAHVRLHDSGGRSTVLDTSALVHESYLRLVRQGELRFDDRRAFFGYASQVMRSVIVDAARERMALRRGGADAQRLTLSTDVAHGLAADDEGIVRVHEALQVLHDADERAAQMVEMRYFGGYSDREIADALGVTERTVQRDWAKAQMLLRVVLSPD